MDSSDKAVLLKQFKKYRMTEFQTAVLSATLDIPKGETRSYKQIAVMIGNPKACRAVGNALRKNPMAPMIPCHRVIKSSGEPGGYDGIPNSRKKAHLLKAENAI